MEGWGNPAKAPDGYGTIASAGMIEKVLSLNQNLSQIGCGTSYFTSTAANGGGRRQAANGNGWRRLVAAGGSRRRPVADEEQEDRGGGGGWGEEGRATLREHVSKQVLKFRIVLIKGEIPFNK